MPDGAAGRALDALAADVRALVGITADPDLIPIVGFDTVRVRPIGIGDYVGPHEEPSGDLTGRRVHATVAVAVRGSDRADLADRALTVTGALLTIAPDDATTGTFLRVSQVDPVPVATVDESDALPQRELRFDVIYELLEGPTDTAGVIAEIPLDLFTGRTGRVPKRLPPVGMLPGVLDGFDVVDDPGADKQRPSEWLFDPAATGIGQRASIWGGTTTGTANLPGTALVLRETPGTPAAADVLVRTEVTSAERGIGLVFRWQSPDTFYYLLLDATDGFRRIGRKVAGTFAELDETAVDLTAGYQPGTPLRLALEAVGDRFTAFSGDEVIAVGRDASIPLPGRVGLLTRRNPTATFSALELWLL